jgi:muramidase (phage lysozyme)
MTQATKSTAKKPKIKNTRDACNNPLAAIEASGAMQYGDIGYLWSAMDFVDTCITFGKKGANTPNRATRAIHKIKPAIPPSMRKLGEALSTDNLKKLQGLIDFAEKQVELDYTGARGHKGISPTNYIIDQYAKEGKYGTVKVASLSKKMCLAYVKVALFQKDYANGISDTGPAKDSVNDWPQFDYADVTPDMKKVEIHYTPKAGSTLKENPINQPDLIYTLPGDLIIYEQVDPVDGEAPGHIDIRTYHHFMSDFTRAHPLPALGAGTGKHFKVKAVYRKISDTMAMVRVEAFLRIIREHVAGETSLKDKNRSYQLKQYDKSAKEPFADLNTDLKTHPFKKEKSKPAGAYQIAYSTWEKMANATAWPQTFTPEMQDRGAMYQLQAYPDSYAHPRRSALGYIMEGELEKALNIIKQVPELADWPGGANQQLVSTSLKTTFDNYVGEESKKISEASKK